MTDPVSNLMHAIASQSPLAPTLAYGAGILTSAGPCLAPKIATVASMSLDGMRKQNALVGVSFACGLACAYALIALSAGLFLRINAQSTWIYLTLSAMLIWQGVRAIVSSGVPRCARHGSELPKSHSFCGAFVGGASYAFVVSPCCTPVIASLAGIAGSLGSAYAVAIAAAFGLGHATPVLIGSSIVVGVRRPAADRARDALAVVGGGAMLALGGYYALLA